jgi:predicted secreted protein
MYRDNGYLLKGIIGIDGSPSCGVHKTCRSTRWSGRNPASSWKFFSPCLRKTNCPWIFSPWMNQTSTLP